MNDSIRESLTPTDLLRLLNKHRKLWIVPTVVCALLSAAYSVVVPRDWRATQALIARAEAAGLSDQSGGRFSDMSEMKTLQETILELAKSQSVVKTALVRTGPAAGSRSGDWPSLEDVDDLRARIRLTPPSGAEFGKTEVFYLSVLDTDRQRAKELVSALCDELEDRMQQLRNQQAHSMIAEVEDTVTMARNDLLAETSKLAQFEGAIGADLAELRHLATNFSGSSDIAQQLRDIEAVRRDNDARRQASQKLLTLLEKAQQDPTRLIAMPRQLLDSQPTLLRQKEALVEARIRTAGVLSTWTRHHPRAQAVIEAESLIREQLRQELDVAIAGVEFDIHYLTERDAELAAQLAAGRQRLSELASTRAEYANLVASVENHTRLLESAQTNLSDVRARGAGAKSASVLGRIDGVEAGIRPVGLGRVATTAAGGVAGLILGLGLVFVTATSPTSTPTLRSQNGVPRSLSEACSVAAHGVAAQRFPEADVQSGDRWPAGDASFDTARNGYDWTTSRRDQFQPVS